MVYYAEIYREYELLYNGTGRADVLTFTATKNILKTKTYKFRVTALNIIGEGPRSPKLEVFVAVVPSPPQNFAFAGLSGAGTIDVKWEAPKYDGGSTLLGYYIYYK